MSGRLNRRQFLQVAAGAAAGTVVTRTTRAADARGVAIVVDPADPVAGSQPARWAAEELVRALTNRGVSARIYARAADAPAGGPAGGSAGVGVAGRGSGARRGGRAGGGRAGGARAVRDTRGRVGVRA